MNHATLCFPLRNNDSEILLGKKVKKIGAGLWNGYGGKLENTETPEEAAVRELRQECGLLTTGNALEKVAALQFYFDGVPSFFVHTFFVRVWRGVPTETPEMKSPTWFSPTKLPYEEMMAADRVWLSRVLAKGEQLAAHIYYRVEENSDGSKTQHFERLVEDEALWKL